MPILITIASGGLVSFALDAAQIIRRVANLLRRDDIDTEILQWLNFAMTEFTDRVDFPELLVDAAPIALVPLTYEYTKPTDFARAGSVFFVNSTGIEYGYHLKPLPRDFYSGDVIDLRRLTHGANISVGDPLYYFINRGKIGTYPALPAGQAGRIELQYYKIPAVLVATVDVPEIDYRWRMYLIWLTLLWGKVMQEQEDVQKVAIFNKKKDTIIADVKGLVRGIEAPREEGQTPSVGMDDADSIF